MARETGKPNPSDERFDRRSRRDRGDIRELLLEAAIVEFGEKGYEGASTLAIARRADAHQPQINYHFFGKEELWRAAVDRLFEGAFAAIAEANDVEDPGRRFALWIRRLVEYFAAHPQLNQIMAKEAAADTERLEWIVERYVRITYDAIRTTWQELRALGVAAPIDADLAHYVIVGAACFPFVQAAEARMLLDGDPFDPERVERHIRGLLAMLLPGVEPA